MSSDVFKPTYLCIKQHSMTKMCYLCKTQKSYEEMLNYKGSGRPHWSNHIKKHGKEFVETPWFCLFYDKEELTKFALMCSEQWNIVKSKEWANEKPENGLDGGGLGNGGANKGKPSKNKGIKLSPRSKEHSDNISTAKKGKVLGPQSAEHTANLAAARKGKKQGSKSKITCPHCNKEIGGQSNFNRWHGDNCKRKI